MQFRGKLLYIMHTAKSTNFGEMNKFISYKWVINKGTFPIAHK